MFSLVLSIIVLVFFSQHNVYTYIYITGVGDKISLLLAPLVASFGVGVPMIAGRGLGHTGGTIDKLESIPGFRCDLSVPEFQRMVLIVPAGSDGSSSSSTLNNKNSKHAGCAITAASPELCPADKKLYALRDVTDTVSSVALQTASIMSKKIAENPDSLVLGKKLLHLCVLGATSGLSVCRSSS